MALALASCRDAPSPKRSEGGPRHETGAAPTTSLTPTATARALHRLHRERDYAGLIAHIVPERRDGMLTFLMAAADVIDANDELCALAESRYGVPSSRTWDLGVMRNNLGVFSESVTFINERQRGDAAEVTIQEIDRVPLVHVRFERREGRWLLAPEVPPPGLAARLNRLAAAIRDVTARIEQGDSYEDYVGAFFSKAMPQIRAIMQMPSDGTSGPVVYASPIDE